MLHMCFAMHLPIIVTYRLQTELWSPVASRQVQMNTGFWGTLSLSP